MFGKKTKRIRELMYENSRLEGELRQYKHDLKTYENKLEHIRKNFDSTPDDCTPGKWCEACAFSKDYRMYNPHHGAFECIYLCNRERSCKNFVQREDL